MSRISLIVSPAAEVSAKQRRQGDPSQGYPDRIILRDQNEALKVVGNAVVLILALAMGGILLYRRK